MTTARFRTLFLVSTLVLLPLGAKADTASWTLNLQATPTKRTVVVPVLMYHYVRPLYGLDVTGTRLSVSPKRFAAQMDELVAKGYQTITPAELDAALTKGAGLPSKPILLTFDDGYYCQYTEALPVLQRLNLQATFFIVPAFMSRRDYMYPKTIQALDATGLATIAAHSEHHLDLRYLPLKKLRAEIQTSKADLEKLTNHQILDFAYPFGGFNKTVEREIQAAGFRTAFSTLYGSRQSSSTIFELRRIRVMNGSSVDLLVRNASKR